MTDRPIIFSAPMIRALLDGRKTQTRRILTPQPEFRGGAGDYHDAEEWGWEDEDGYHVSVLNIAPNGYQVGNRLWVREAFRGSASYDSYPPIEWPRLPVHYEADPFRDVREGMGADGKLRPSIHMPRWASRLTLTVTDVRVQRLHDISEADAEAEGIEHHGGRFTGYGKAADQWMGPIDSFASLWISINGPAAWDANPWVVALTFTTRHGNIDSIGNRQ